MSAADSATLAGRRILIPRGGAWGARVQAACAARGATGVIAPLIEAKPPRDVAALEDYLRRLEAGVLTASRATAIRRLALLNPSTLAQIIPASWPVPGLVDRELS